MNGKNDTVVCDPEALQTFAGRILAGAGTPDDIAAVVAEDLVDANLAGHDSHGVIRVPQYVKAIADGEIRPTGRATAVADRGATAVVSGEWGFGQASGRFASDLAVERAHCYGVAAVALIRCNHLGRIGAFMERISAGGCVGMMWVGGIGGAHQAVPFGGAKPAYGANPLAAGVPLPSGDPFILDIATTAVAGGKVMVAYDRGEPVPPGTIVDRAGNPTTDPAALLDGGALLPFGGHKGSGLAILVELLGQALAGGDLTADEGFGGPFAAAGALIVAIDAGAFRPEDAARRRAGEIADRVRAVPPAPGYDAVRIPGDPEAETRKRRGDGIPLPRKTLDDLRQTAAHLGIDPAVFLAMAPAVPEDQTHD